MTVRIERITGPGLTAAIPALARLRMQVFRDWPYLYDGTLEYEREYLGTLASAAGAIVVAAYDGHDMIGAATASPMQGHADEFAEPFLQRGYNTARVFYLGESVLLPAYRGRGLGHAFFEQREAHAREISAFDLFAFCAVVRPQDHPLRPAAYTPLDVFWRKRGYDKLDGVVASFSWKDVDQPHETAKPMQFWVKPVPK